MPELALDDDERYAFVRHLDCMRVAELVRRKSPPHPSLDGEPPKLAASSGR